MNEKSPRIQRGFVRILKEGGSPIGCGFLLSYNYICTCAHLINAALSLDLNSQAIPKGNIDVDFPFLRSMQKIATRVYPDGWAPMAIKSRRSPYGDIALLEIIDGLPNEAQPLPVSGSMDLWKHPFASYGYPQDKMTGAWATGVLLSSDDQGLIQIQDLDQTGYFVQRGFSGTPVWDEVFDRVVGIVTQAEAVLTKRVAFVIPIFTIREFYSEAFLSLEKPFDRLCDTPPNSPTGYGNSVQDFFRIYMGTEKRPEPFGGRTQQLEILDNWLFSKNSDRLLVVAPPGRGKTMLLVRWAVKIPKTYSVIFIPISIRKRTNRPEIILQALAAHLAQAVGQNLPQDPINPVYFYHDKILEYIDQYREAKRKKLVIIIDGLDEALNFSEFEEGLFPESQIKNIKLIISARLISSCPDRKSWLNRLSWASSSDSITIPPLDQNGLIDVLQKMGCPINSLIQKKDIVDQLFRLTLGDPLLVSLHVKNLWSHSKRNISLNPQELSGLSPGVEGYIDKWFQDQKKLWGDKSPLKQNETLSVLAILACALAPLKAGEIVQILKFIIRNETVSVLHIIESLERFVIGNPDSDGYVLSHSKISDFLCTPDNRIIDSALLARARAAILAWGKESLTLSNEKGKVGEPSEYLMLYYIRHLIRENAPVEDFMALVEDGWRHAWYLFEGGYRGFAKDVWMVLKQVEDAANNSEGKISSLKNHFFAEKFRCVFSLSSVHTLSMNVSGTLIKLGIKNGILSDHQAINLISLKEGRERTSSLISIAGIIQDQNLSRLLEIAENISDNQERFEVMSCLAKYVSVDLKPKVLSEVLNAARKINSKRIRALSMGNLISQLPESKRPRVLVETFQMIRNIRDERFRVNAISNLAPNLSDNVMSQVKEDALKTVRGISESCSRSWALIILLPYCSGTLKQQLLIEAFQVTQSIEDESSRVKRLISLLHQLSNKHRPLILQQILEEVQHIKKVRGIREGDHEARVKALVALTPYLSDSNKHQILLQALEQSQYAKGDFINIQSDEEAQIRIIIALVPHLSNELKSQAVSQLFEVVKTILESTHTKNVLRRIRSHSTIAKSLISFAPHLSGTLKHKLLKKAVKIARKSKSKWSKVNALAASLPHLDENHKSPILIEILELLRSVENTSSQSLILDKISPYLSKTTLKKEVLRVFNEAQRIGDNKYQAETLISMLPFLSVDFKEEYMSQVLDKVRSINDKESMAKNLINLIPYLPDGLKSQVISEVRKVALSISYKGTQADILIELQRVSPNINQPQLELEAFKIVLSISNEFSRSLSLRSLFPHLSEGLKLRAIEALKNITHKGFKNETLGAMMRHSPDYLKPQVFEMVSYTTIEESQGNALKGIAPYLPDTLIRKAVGLTLSITNDESRANALKWIAPYLPEDLKPQVIVAAQNFEDKEFRANILITLLPYLPIKVERDEVVHGAIKAAKKIKHPKLKANALIRLLTYLTDNSIIESVVFEVIEAAKEIKDLSKNYPGMTSWERHLVLMNLYNKVPDNLKSQIFSLCIDLERNLGRGHGFLFFLKIITYHLPEDHKSQIFEEAQGFTWGLLRAQAMSSLAKHFSDDVKIEMLNSWLKTVPVLKRRILLETMISITHDTNHLIRKKEMEEVFKQILEVSRWWP